ncbi:MAG: baseplate J/gp47 family protein [Ktedonobacteraceae bacterium]
MADEQIIYLSPEEELTSVRERLESIPTRRIILVIPAQTQLRSHVSWRLLHARVRELDKEILIISSDRQIRSVVKAAGFKVADSLESSPTSKNRGGSRTGRSILGGRPSSHVKTPPGRGTSGQRTNAANSGQDRTHQFEKHTSKPLDADSMRSQRNNTNGSMMSSSSIFGEDDSHFGSEINYSVPGRSTSSTSKPSTPPSIPSTPSIHPLEPSYQDEEPDLFLEDFQRARSIREAAQKNDPDRMVPPSPQSAISPDPTRQIFDLSSAERAGDDPLHYIDDDDDAVSLPEQHGSVSFDELYDSDVNGVDITNNDTANILHVEDEGDLGDFVHDSGAQPYPSWVDADPDEGLPRPPRMQNVSKRTNQTSRMPVQPLMPPPPAADEDDLSPIYDRSTRNIPSPSTANQAGAPAYTGNMGTREPQPLPLSPQRPQASKTVRPGLKKRPETGARRNVTSPRVTGKIPLSAKQPQRKQSKKKRNNSPLITILAVVLVLVLIGLVALLVPSADVTLTLPSHEYPVPMSLTANATSQQNTTLKTVPAHLLSFDTSATGTGHATGTTTVGTIQADGTVIFTNTGTTGQVIIPTGTIINTKSGIQFVTLAEALAVSGTPIPTPVKAQNAGVSGNVAAGSITVIPPASIASIQQANPTGTVVNLTVTNTDPTAHGGAGNATSLSSKDVATEKSALDIQLQARVKDFLAKNVLPGDQTGKTVQVETPTFSPKIGDVVNNGTFTETLRLHMTVLVVRASDLQTAASAQLKNTLAQAKTGWDLVPQQPVQLKQVKNGSPSNGTSVKLSFTAVGQVAPRISEDAVRNLVYGKSVDGAQQALVGRSGIPNAIHAQITVNPSFFHFVPFWTQRITVHFKTVLQPTTPTKKTTTPKSR